MASLVLAYFGFTFVLSTTFDCSQDNQCASQNLKCDDGEDCFIYCTRYQSCQYTTFTCPKSNNANVNVSCNIVCGDGTTLSADTCEYTTIDAYYSDLFSLNINGIYDYQVQYSMNVTCPCDGKCNIDCGNSTKACYVLTVNAEQSELTITSTGDEAYYFMEVRAEYASKLTMTASGSQSFIYAFIYCPQADNGNSKCNLEYTGDYMGFFLARIYAINSFCDINMICNGPQGFSTEQCYYGGSSISVYPTMYCFSDDTHYCAMETEDGINWACTDPTNICAVTQLGLRSGVDNIDCEAPTESPTYSPTGSSSTVIVLSVVFGVLFIVIVVGSLLYCRRMKHVKRDKFVEIKENYQSVNYNVKSELQAVSNPQDHSLPPLYNLKENNC